MIQKTPQRLSRRKQPDSVVEECPLEKKEISKKDIKRIEENLDKIAKECNDKINKEYNNKKGVEGRSFTIWYRLHLFGNQKA